MKPQDRPNSARHDVDYAVAKQSRRFTHARARNIALDLEARGEWHAALEVIRDVPKVDALRSRLLRKINHEPAVHIECEATLVMHDTLSREPLSNSVYHAYIGAVAEAVIAPRNVVSAAWTESLLESMYSFIRTIAHLHNQHGDPVFGLRIIKHSKHPSQGMLKIAFLIRASAESRDDAHAAALELWATLAHLLPGNARQYFYRPIFDEDEIQHLLRPFAPKHIALITRRTTEINGAAIYHPFRPGNLELHRFCQALLHHPQDAMVSIHLLPTTLMAWEQQSLWGTDGDNAIPEGIILRLDEDEAVTLWQQTTEHDQKAESAAWLRRSLQESAFAVQIAVASAASTIRLLPEQIAAELFGPSSGSAFGGGSTVVNASEAEMHVARRNLDTLDVEMWTRDSSRLPCLLGEQETALAFRLPIPTTHGIPGLRALEIKPTPPPPVVPDGTVLGQSVIRHGAGYQRITQSLNDRRRHTYIVGKTGTGKSTLLRVLTMQDIEQGHGVCVIDPHGDLVEDILLRILPERANDVILFDPSDIAHPIGLNLLEAHNEQEKHIIVNEFIGLLKMLYDPHNMAIVGPRFQHNVRNAMLTAMCVPGSTLIEVVMALTDNKFVKRLLPHVKDPIVRNYWEQQIANTNDFHKSEILDYLISKFSNFIGDQRVRNIIGQSKTTLDFRRLMDERKILLVNLSKGKMGPESAQFIGLLVVQRLLIAALGRADAPLSKRPDFMLYVDEFQNFATPMFSTMLSEGRKYGLVITIANQYLSQLAHGTFDAVMGNVGTFVSFRVGQKDALILAQEMQPVFQPDDLINLPRYTAAVKLLVNGIAGDSFAMTTLSDWLTPDARRAARIRKLSQKTYGRPESEVTQEILSRMLPPKPDAPPTDVFRRLVQDDD